MGARGRSKQDFSEPHPISNPVKALPLLVRGSRTCSQSTELPQASDFHAQEMASKLCPGFEHGQRETRFL